MNPRRRVDTTKRHPLGDRLGGLQGLANIELNSALPGMLTLVATGSIAAACAHPRLCVQLSLARLLQVWMRL